MSWTKIIGQERVKRLLQNSLRANRLAHAYLFYGAEGIGKDALALEFARAINCSSGASDACGSCPSCKKFETLQHPDVKLVFPLPVGKGEKQGDDPFAVLTEDQILTVREQVRIKAEDPYHKIEIAKANFIKINSIRGIKRESSMSRSEGGKKIFILFNAELMNNEASNSLLKTLEEPLPDTVILLTTSAKESLLPTILSRCQTVQCDFLLEEDIFTALQERDGVEKGQSRLAARLANGSYGLARILTSADMAAQREEVVDFLRLSLSKQRLPMLQAVDELSSTYDRTAMQRWLEVLQIWLREALLLQKTGNDTGLAWDQESLKRFVRNFPQANLIGALDLTNQAIAQIDKNGYLPLILMNVSLGLRKNLTE
jgi:DNA polymerase III subunit delta'